MLLRHVDHGASLFIEPITRMSVDYASTIPFDGLSARELFSDAIGLTYDDFILLPGHINFSVGQVDLKSKFSRNIPLNVPFCSSPMDTVTESEMAIAMALQGGIGVIHYNNTIQEQADHVRVVKRYRNGFITNPLVLT